MFLLIWLLNMYSCMLLNLMTNAKRFNLADFNAFWWGELFLGVFILYGNTYFQLLWKIHQFPKKSVRFMDCKLNWIAFFPFEYLKSFSEIIQWNGCQPNWFTTYFFSFQLNVMSEMADHFSRSHQFQLLLWDEKWWKKWQFSRKLERAAQFFHSYFYCESSK